MWGCQKVDPSAVGCFMNYDAAQFFWGIIFNKPAFYISLLIHQLGDFMVHAKITKFLFQLLKYDQTIYIYIHISLGSMGRLYVYQYIDIIEINDSYR